MKGILTSDIHYGIDGRGNDTANRFFRRISKEEWDFMIIAGDIQSDHPDQFESFGEMVRSHISTSKPIYIVYGNHDYWDPTVRFVPFENHDQWYEYHHERKDKIAKEYDLHYLQGNPVELDGVTILGFDGWYAHPNPPTQDITRIPEVPDVENCHSYLFRKADAALDEIMQYPFASEKKIIIVNHFQTFVSERGGYYSMDGLRDKSFCGSFTWDDYITDIADVYCVGHSHKKFDFMKNNCRVINSGSDYWNPAWKTFTI